MWISVPHSHAAEPALALERELTDSVDRLTPMAQTFSEKAAEAEALVYELYEVPARLRCVVDAEYGQA